MAAGYFLPVFPCCTISNQRYAYNGRNDFFDQSQPVGTVIRSKNSTILFDTSFSGTTKNRAVNSDSSFILSKLFSKKAPCWDIY